MLGFTKEAFQVLPALISGRPPFGITKRPENMFNRDRSTPHQLLSSCFSISYSDSPFALCGSGLGDPIYATRQLSTGRPGRLQCGVLFAGLHRIQKMQLRREQVKSHTEQHGHTGCVIRSHCCIFAFMLNPRCPSADISCPISFQFI